MLGEARSPGTAMDVMRQVARALARSARTTANTVALLLALPAAATCWLESALRPGAESVFLFWAQAHALLPGAAGMCIRRAFYKLTLEACTLDCHIGFGALLPHRGTRIETQVYIGPYAMIGSAHLHPRCMIGSRASLTSGCHQHEPTADGGWTACSPESLRRIDIASDVWIGEAAVVMADVGAGSQVAAGAVVSSNVTANVLVAGNPARFVRRLRPALQTHTATAAAAGTRG